MNDAMLSILCGESFSYFFFSLLFVLTSSNIQYMVKANAETKCSICYKETATFMCKRCSKNFCVPDLQKHLEILSTDFITSLF